MYNLNTITRTLSCSSSLMSPILHIRDDTKTLYNCMAMVKFELGTSLSTTHLINIDTLLPLHISPSTQKTKNPLIKTKIDHWKILMG